MHQTFFSFRFRRYTQLFFFGLCVFFAFTLGASANDRCPSSDDHALSAVKYQLFTAYQTGYDGYQAPCENKCFGKQNCVVECQTKKALEYLNNQLVKLEKKNKVKSCETYQAICIDQCKEHGAPCEKACKS